MVRAGAVSWRERGVPRRQPYRVRGSASAILDVTTNRCQPRLRRCIHRWRRERDYFLLWGHLGAAWTAQASMRNIALAVAPWADNHPGLTMLMVPDHDGAIVMGRNAQGGLVLEPIQKQPYLHLVLPTLTSEIQLRQEQFSRGLARRLEIVRPRLVDAGTLAAILEPAEAGWPKHVACWSKSQQKIIPLSTPTMDASAEAWLASIRIDIENCGR